MPVPVSVDSDQKLPPRADVVIIGGGIAGITTALELAERGISVVVCEKGIVAGEQSSRNWGWCRQMGRDPRELPLIQISMDLWRAMRQRTGAETGFRECGIAYLCDTDKSMAARQDWFEKYADAHGLSTRLLSASEAQALTPNCNLNWKGGLFTPNDGRAEPTFAVPAMAKAAQAKGALIFQNCAVRGIEKSAGRISGVVTEMGAIACDSVVLAGGAWSRRFCHNMGLRLPQLSVVSSAMRTDPIETGLAHSIAGSHFAARKRIDGGYTVANLIYSVADIMPDSFRFLRDFWPVLKDEWRDYHFRVGGRFFDEAKLARRWALDEISPFEKIRILEAKQSKRIQMQALSSLRAALPVFEKATIAETWCGVIDVTPDVVPVISPVQSQPSFFMATGFSGHGFGLGPGAGKLMAELVTGETPCVDPSPFRFERF